MRRSLLTLFTLLFFAPNAFAAITLASYTPDKQYDLSNYFSEDELVVTASRYTQPISQVAENISVITAHEIAAMHVHTVAEVLEQVAGLSIDFFGHDFGGNEYNSLLGSNSWHVLVLIDGVRYNNASAGDALTNGIPLQIIKRIEIIKGPASSVWGSSLGGVVNLITKDAGGSVRPQGTFAASYGEANSRVMELDVFGEAGSLGYYFYAGSHNSDGLWKDRYFANDPFYGKISLALPRDMELQFTLGHSSPNVKMIELPGSDFTQEIINRSSFASLSLDIPLQNNLSFYLAGNTFQQNYHDDRNVMGLGLLTSGNGDQMSDNIWDEKTYGLEGRLTWWTDTFNAVVGAESSRSEMDNSLEYGIVGWEGFSSIAPLAQDEKRAAFTNLTWQWQDLTITPGIRYDYHSISDEFISPSLGLTYLLNDNNLLRATASQGFSYPYLSLISGDGSNPDLQPEKIMAYQVGLENNSLELLKLKVNLFQQNIKDVFVSGTPWTNQGKERRRGFEIDLQSSAWHLFSAAANFTLAQRDNIDRDNDVTYRGNFSLNYDDLQAWSARLDGHYTWWYSSDTADYPSATGTICNLSLNRKFKLAASSEMEFFLAVHNIFDGSQYHDSDFQNPGRWVESGIKISF